MYFGLDTDIGLQPLSAGELPDTNSGDSVNIALPKLQRETDSASTPSSKLLSDYIIVENNSNRIDESVLKADFYNTLDKKCQEEHHQNFEELSKQSLKNALEFQGRVYQDFTKEKAKLSEQQLVSSDKCEYPCIVTDCSFTHKHRVTIKRHLFKHIKVSPYYCEQCLPHTFFVRDMAALNRHKSSVHVLDKVISKRDIKRIHQPVQNTMNGSSGFTVNQVSDQQKTDSASTPGSNLLSDYTIAQVENNSKYQDHCNRTFSSSNTSNSKDSRKKANSQILNRIDEKVLKTNFYNALDEKCQEEHHQNFEELSKQSLKNALEFQGRFYQAFTKEKVNLSEKQLVSTDECEYPCIVTDCSFTHKDRATIKWHLFKHIKVSPYYCEQCLPHTFFLRDMAALNEHKINVHVLDKVISKRGINQIHQPVQNTINGSSGFTVNQESDPCSLLNSAKRAKTDP